MNVYDINKAYYQNAKPIEDFSGVLRQVRAFLKARPAKYYMIINHELHYYTTYTFKDKFHPTEMAEDIVDLIKTLGGVKDVSGEDDKLEFWIEKNGEIHMFGLFDYDWGVIEIE